MNRGSPSMVRMSNRPSASHFSNSASENPRTASFKPLNRPSLVSGKSRRMRSSRSSSNSSCLDSAAVNPLSVIARLSTLAAAMKSPACSSRLASEMAAGSDASAVLPHATSEQRRTVSVSLMASMAWRLPDQGDSGVGPIHRQEGKGRPWSLPAADTGLQSCGDFGDPTTDTR